MNWNVACDCHAWIIGGIHDAAEGELGEWLYPTSERYDLDLAFSIGGRDGVPAKIFRPDSPGQPVRTLKQANEKFRAIQSSLGPELAPSPEPEVRFAMEKDDDGRVTNVSLVQLTLAGDAIYAWTIWTADAEITSIDDAPRPEAVELDAPLVQLQEEEERQARGEGNEKQEGA